MGYYSLNCQHLAGAEPGTGYYTSQWCLVGYKWNKACLIANKRREKNKACFFHLACECIHWKATRCVQTKPFYLDANHPQSHTCQWGAWCDKDELLGYFHISILQGGISNLQWNGASRNYFCCVFFTVTHYLECCELLNKTTSDALSYFWCFIGWPRHLVLIHEVGRNQMKWDVYTLMPVSTCMFQYLVNIS